MSEYSQIIFGIILLVLGIIQIAYLSRIVNFFIRKDLTYIPDKDPEGFLKSILLINVVGEIVIGMILILRNLG